MLSPPSEEEWVYQPGNPNFMVRADKPPKEKEEEEEEEEEEEVTPKKPRLTCKSTEPTPYDEMAYTILEQALAPLYRFIGMLEAESGKPVYYRYLPDTPREYKMVPINYGAQSREDFLRLNPQLSAKVVAAIFRKTKKEEPVAPEFKPYAVKLEQALIGEEYNIRTQEVLWPDWFYFQMGSPVFRFLLASSSFGALELAANELGFKLEDLIYSPHVNYMFAQFVAKKFVSPKGNAYADGFAGGQTVYRVSSGFRTTQMANTKWIMGCKLWFQDVYYAENEINMPELQQKILDLFNVIAADQARLNQPGAAVDVIGHRIHQNQQILKKLEAELKSFKHKVLKK